MKVNNKVVLVDKQDNRLRVLDKLKAHEGKGRLHRAVSVLLYRRNGKGKEVLLQKRSRKKRLWGGYWANSCCTHPYPGEGYVECGVRRLKEELGVEIGREDLRVVDRFAYQAEFGEGMSENELDTVLVGEYEGGVEEDSEEVEELRWVSWKRLKREIEEESEDYAPWLRKMIERGKLGELMR